MDVAQVDKIINAVGADWHVVAVAVPTRALRLIRNNLALIFRVEQLDAKTWTWRAISTHAGDEAWESLGPAIQDMINKQARFKEKVKLAQHEQRMAMIKAENPHGLN